MVDNVRLEQLHLELGRLGAGVGIHLDVKRQDASELGQLPLVHARRLVETISKPPTTQVPHLDHVDLGDVANAKVADGNVGGLEKVQQRLERSQRAALHVHAGAVLVDGGAQPLKLLHHGAAGLALGKALFYRQLEGGIAAAYDDAARTMACNMMDESALEGVQAFIEKRPPGWQ